jgi:hypothetical protein
MYKFMKTIHPCGIRTRDLMYCRRTQWPLCHVTKAYRAIVYSGLPCENNRSSQKLFRHVFFSHEMLCNDFAKRKNGSDKILCVFFANPSVHPAWEKALPFLLDCVAASPLTHQGLIRLVSEFAEDNNERRTRHEKLRFVVVRPNWMLLTDCPLLPLDSFRRKKCYFC